MSGYDPDAILADPGTTRPQAAAAGSGMTMHLRPGRAVDREPDTRSYTDGWRAAKADSRRLLELADALLRDRVTPDGRALLDELLVLHAEDEEAAS